MRLPAGQPGSGSAARFADQARRGFTLIELILVMALLTVVISLTAPRLSRFFHGRTLDSEARRLLFEYGWPGNVRELENTIERLVALSPDGELDLSLLDAHAKPDTAPPAFGLRERVEAYERGLIVETLKACRNNRSEAARRLGLSRATLHDKLKKHGIAGSDGLEE